MDFQSPPAIIDALVKRAQHGFFGYSVIGHYHVRPQECKGQPPPGTADPANAKGTLGIERKCQIRRKEKG